MATYYVWSGAAGTDTGGSWTNAFLTFGQAITAATTAGDVILVHYTHQEELAADTTYTITAGQLAIISVDKDNSDAPRVMGTDGWIGNSTTNRSVTFSGTDDIWYAYGITLRVSGSTTDNMTLAFSSGANATYESCYFWLANTVTTARIRLQEAAERNSRVTCIDCTFRFSNASQGIETSSTWEIIGGSVSSAGTAPTALFTYVEGTNGRCTGFDVSFVTGTLVPNTASTGTFVFDRCKLGSGVTVLAAQTSNPTLGSPQVFLFDCHSGDTHGIFGYYNALGEVVSDKGTYFTSGDAAQSWKITTTSHACRQQPFITPPIDVYHSGTSAITPYLECLRNDGTATARTDAEVFATFRFKGTANVVTASGSSDRQAVGAYLNLTGGSAQAAGAGTGSWTIASSNSPASFKIDSGSAITPAESGSLTARISVSTASITVFVDPQIRGLS